MKEKRKTMHSSIPFEDGFLKPSLYSCILRQFLKNRCRNAFSNTVLVKPPLKSYNYLQKCHCLTYDISFCRIVVKDHFLVVTYFKWLFSMNIYCLSATGLL